MRQVQFAEAEEHFADAIAQVEAGESLTIVREGRPVAEIIPFRRAAPSVDEPERQAAVARLTAMMEQGIDMCGFKITNRDELYDRE